MPVNDSSTGGPLVPGPGVYTHSFMLATDPAFWINTYPPDGQPLDDFLQQLLVGITQLPSAYVRPLWQPEPPALPTYGLDWMAMGIVNTTLDRGFPWIDFDPLPVQLPVDALGNPIAAFGQQHETIELQCTCYGEHAAYYDGLIADGFMVGQNQELLLLVSMALTEVGSRRYVPELIQNRWWPRVDRVIRIHRERRRLYPILNIIDAAGVIVRDDLPEC